MTIFKKIVLSLSLLLPLFTTPIFSQQITIEQSQLEQIIKEEIAIGISKAVDEAVAVAVKEIEIKYINIIAEKDIELADLRFDLKTAITKYDYLSSQYNQVITELTELKKIYGFPYNLLWGGIIFTGGVVLGGLTSLYLTRLYYIYP